MTSPGQPTPHPTFANAYALLIGVDASSVPKWALPPVKHDVDALAAVLLDPQRCAYLPAHVKVITGTAATRQNILEGLDWLQGQVAGAGPNATAVIFYSGHGWCDTGMIPPSYYLVPYDVREDRLRASALRGEDFAEAVAAVRPRRLLVLLDCCHAGGLDVKDLALPPAGYTVASLPPDLLLGPDAGMAQGVGEKGLEQLQVGTGRAVLSSCRNAQSSYIRSDGTLSIFTYHLIEALTGHAQPQGGATEVLVSDVLGHVYRQVPASARDQWSREQQPDGRMTGNFAVALLLGGKGLAPGAAAPDPLADPAAAHPGTGGGTTIHVTGSGAVATGGGVAAGAGGVAVGGDVHGGITIGGKLQ